VPSVEQLAKLRLAKPAARTAKGAITAWVIDPEGQQMIYDAMHENALELRAADDEHRRITPVTPPSRWDA